MRLSQSFVRTAKTPPADTETVNARLLQQAGFVDQLMAGVYSYLPLGLQVLRNIEQIVREEMDGLGANEVLMPTLHPKANWVKTGGWDNIDVLFKINSRTGNEYAMGQSEEEVVTPLVMSRVLSYKQLPTKVYQIGWKYRDELRAKSGIMRGREFLMKDMYSFHTTQADFDKFYQEAKQVYLRIFSRLGLVAKATEASGGAFTKKLSYEFMVLTDAGEDDILYCEACDYCINTEITKTAVGAVCPCGNGTLLTGRACEVGNVFDLGQKYGQDFDLGYVDENSVKQYPIMGCYGIGISRIMGVIVEKYNDELGIVWPKSVAPALVYLVSIPGRDNAALVLDTATKLYSSLQAAGISVLWDDRELSPGAKFGDADLVGIPLRLVISDKTLASNEVEWKERTAKEATRVSLDAVIAQAIAFK
jgi:prolyl-tRNA synthetase